MHKTSRINFYPQFLHFHFIDSNTFNTLVINFVSNDVDWFPNLLSKSFHGLEF